MMDLRSDEVRGLRYFGGMGSRSGEGRGWRSVGGMGSRSDEGWALVLLVDSVSDGQQLIDSLVNGVVCS